MCKPDFYIVGAPKAGTTSLYRYLRQHPGIFLSGVKEPRFFVDTEFYRGLSPPHCRKVQTVDDYLALYADAPEQALLGDASPQHLYSQGAASRIHEFTPNARIVALLRSPVDRAYSHYCLYRRIGLERSSFEEAIACESWRPGTLRYVEHGFYMAQLRPYLDRFGADAVAVLFTDDLRRDPSDVCRRVCAFLGVDQGVHIDTSTRHNQGTLPRSAALARCWRSIASGDTVAKRVARHVVASVVRRAARTAAQRLLLTRRIPPMREDTRRDLAGRYRADVAELEKWTGRDLGHWLC